MIVYFIMMGLLLLLCWIMHLTSLSSSTLTIGETLGIENIEKRKRKDRRIVIFLIFFVLAFVAAFRYKVGTDFSSYYKTSNWAGKFQQGEFDDPGFTLFSLLAEFLFQGKNGAITILAAIVTVALFVFTIDKHGENLTVSLLLFIFVGCFTGLFNGVRQYLAAGILFAGFHFVQEKKFFKWLLVVLIATSIHVTAILMIFVYFVSNMKCNGMTVVLYFIVGIALLYLYEPLFNLVGALKQEEVDTGLGYVSRQVNILRVAVQCVPLIMFVFVDKNGINQDVETRCLFNICLLNASFAIAGMNSPYLSRFCIYTMCFQVLMYPKIFKKMNKDNRNIFTSLLLFFYFIFWLYETSNSVNLNNFQWIFKYL